MKKIAIFILLIVIVSTALHAGVEKRNYFLLINPRVAGIVSYNELLRGLAVSTQISLNLLFFRIGGEAILEYDYFFNTNQVALLAQLGIGRYFWVSVGQSIPLGDPHTNIEGTITNFEYGGFPNTFGLGFRVPLVDMDYARLGVAANFTYTVTSSGPVLDIFDIGEFFLAIFGGIKGYFAVEMSFGI